MTFAMLLSLINQSKVACQFLSFFPLRKLLACVRWNSSRKLSTVYPFAILALIAFFRASERLRTLGNDVQIVLYRSRISSYTPRAGCPPSGAVSVFFGLPRLRGFSSGSGSSAGSWSACPSSGVVKGFDGADTVLLE